jgi:2-hydroxycyclohexanecarboxyl-CoA dehydrogenase
MNLQDRTVLVTGAGSGIGRAIARKFAACGAMVIATDLSGESAEKVAHDIAARGEKARAFAMDICDPAAIDQVKAALAADGLLPDVLVNNAGWDRPEPFLKNTPDIWQRVIAVNFLGPITVTRAFLDPMIESGKGGRIINISSDAGRVGSSGETVYAGAKGGMIAFTKSLAREMARYRINVNCVCPGPTDTSIFSSNPEKIREALTRAIPFRRIAQPEDIAGPVAFFATEEAGYITGQVLSVSGGLTMVG